MDNKTNVKPEAPPSNDDLSNEKAFYTADLETKIKTETTTSGNEFEAHTKTEANVHLQNEGQRFYKNVESNIKNNTTRSNYDFEMDSKINIKEEPIFPDTELSNMEYLDCTSLSTKIKNDTMTSNDCKMESKTDYNIKEFASEITSENDVKPLSVDLVMKIKKESFTCSDRDEETITKTETDCQSKTPLVADISQSHGNEESDSGTAEDLPASEPPRFTSTAVYRDGSSHTLPYASDAETSSGKNVDKETAMRPNICNPANDTQHFESEENIQLYKCKVYEKKFSCQVLLNRQSCHSQRKSYRCDICGKYLTRKHHLKMHTLAHTGLKPFKCEYCGKCFTLKHNLTKHILFHIGSKPFKCEHCGKCFTQKSDLKTHSLIHTGSKPFKCAHCEKCFRWKSGLKLHSLVHSVSKPFKCEHCDKCFKLKSNLNSHRLVHIGSKPFKCEHCDKCFTHKLNLISHTLVHTGSKPFKCEQCDKCFAHKASLSTHKLLHTASKPFKCGHCDKCFTHKLSLNRHILIHTGSKPYKCEHCDKCFARKSGLNSHILVHTGSKPYKCEHCNKSFALKSSLKRHSASRKHKSAS